MKKWIFIAQFHLQDPDPDTAWRFDSGSTRTRIRNTASNIKIECHRLINYRYLLHFAETKLQYLYQNSLQQKTPPFQKRAARCK
jgi:hypothetical protein